MSDILERLTAALEGRYKIERMLGEGGMATVYLADDLKHDRKVALKVLKPELGAIVGAERFLGEIKVTAKLQHPNILPLHDSGEADKLLFYVMPHVEGESLRERLDREKQLPVDEAVKIVTEVADALDHAHRKGVIHRDIKPANILLSDGRPLIADFGIALAVSVAGGGRLTETGLSVGTPYYMSPEQASADRELGTTSDVYSLGCVLYEMLVGDPPHVGSNAQAVLAKILTDVPTAPHAVRPTVPAHVDAAIRKALEKLPADRFTSAGEFGSALGDESFTYRARTRTATALTGRASGPPTAATVQPWHRDRRLLASAMVGATMTALAAWGWLSRPPIPEPGVPMRLEVTGLDLTAGGRSARFAISPDGRWIVSVHTEDGLDYALYIRSADDTEWQRLPNTERAHFPTFSPDGQSVAFQADGAISRVPITGGVALPVASGSFPHWGVGDVIVYEQDGAIYRVAGSGGEPEVLFDSDTIQAAWPHFLPSGRAVVFSTDTRGDALNGRIMVFEIETGDLRELVPSGNHPRYVPTGHLLYGHGDGALMGVAFDLETLQTTGSPVTLIPDLNVGVAGASSFAVSEAGTLLYQARGGESARLLVEMDLQGVETPLRLSPGSFSNPRYSPDGNQIAYVEDVSNIRIYDVASGASPLFSSLVRFPMWSGSGEYLYFITGRGGPGDIYRRPADSSEEAEQVSDRPLNQLVGHVSADDSIAVVVEARPDRGLDLLLMRQDADGVEFETSSPPSGMRDRRPEVTPEVDPKIMGLPRYFWERGSLRSVNEYP